MNKQDKELLLKDLSARLPYGVKIYVKGHDVPQIIEGILHLSPNVSFKTENCYSVYLTDIKPYLRPMSSMTKEEFSKVKKLFGFEITTSLGKTYIDDWKQGLNEINYIIDLIDWLNAHHLDYRGWIKKGLALPAPEGMYNF